MAKMVVVYKTPKNPAAFDRHYYDIHLPLAKTLPGLISYEVSQGPVMKLCGDWVPYLVATLTFKSLDAIKTAFASPEGQACAVDRRIYAPDDADHLMYLFDDRVF